MTKIIFFRNTTKWVGNKTKEAAGASGPHLSHRERALEYEKRMADYRYTQYDAYGIEN